MFTGTRTPASPQKKTLEKTNILELSAKNPTGFTYINPCDKNKNYFVIDCNYRRQSY
jgi:hypothetical protein